MELTRKEAIENFREQYRYIAEQYLSGRVEYLGKLKEEYLRKVGHEVENNCYLCEYAEQQKEMNEQKNNSCLLYKCSYCPINFMDMDYSYKDEKYLSHTECIDYLSVYWKLDSYCLKMPVHFRDNKYMAELALKIANLSEKE